MKKITLLVMMCLAVSLLIVGCAEEKKAAPTGIDALIEGGYADGRVVEDSPAAAVPKASSSGNSFSDDDLEDYYKGDCSYIDNDDLKNYCKGDCSYIKDDDMKDYCKGDCSYIDDDDLKDACKDGSASEDIVK